MITRGFLVKGSRRVTIAAVELPGESQAKPEENSSSGQDGPVDGFRGSGFRASETS